KLENVGKVGDLPPDPSPICLWTEGVYRGRSFQVLGRIIYEWDDGGWNEWHLVFNDGASGWLSDAQLQYAISFRIDGAPLPPRQELFPGKFLRLINVDYQVTTITQARYKGVEGELPFPYVRGAQQPPEMFTDLRTSGRAFG